MKNKQNSKISGLALDIDETLSWTIGHWIKEMQKLFGNPENLSVKEMAEKYKYTQNVPYWQTKEALAWMDSKRECNDTQKELPLIKNANHAINEIHKIIPISAYVTIRPESVMSGTQEWLNKHNFPKAPIICRPNNLPHAKGNEWKANLLKELYPKIVGIIDDNPAVVKYLEPDYKGKVFVYNSKQIETKIDAIPCKDWDAVVKEVKKWQSKSNIY